VLILGCGGGGDYSSCDTWTPGGCDTESGTTDDTGSGATLLTYSWTCDPTVSVVDDVFYFAATATLGTTRVWVEISEPHLGEAEIYLSYSSEYDSWAAEAYADDLGSGDGDCDYVNQTTVSWYAE